MLAYPSVTTPNLYSDPSLWSVSHCSNLERTSGKASALSTVSFQTERKKTQRNGFGVPITSCNLITTRALKKRFVYREALHWTLNRLFVVEDLMFIFRERGAKKKSKKSEPLTRFKLRPPGSGALDMCPAYCQDQQCQDCTVWKYMFRPPRKSTALQDGYPG